MKVVAREEKKKDGSNKAKYHLLGTCDMLGTGQKFSPVLTQLSEAQALIPTFQMRKLKLKRLSNLPKGTQPGSDRKI